MARAAEQRPSAEQRARLVRPDRSATELHAVGSERAREIDAIVHDQARAGGPDHVEQSAAEFEPNGRWARVIAEPDDDAARVADGERTRDARHVRTDVRDPEIGDHEQRRRDVHGFEAELEPELAGLDVADALVEAFAAAFARLAEAAAATLAHGWSSLRSSSARPASLLDG